MAESVDPLSTVPVGGQGIVPAAFNYGNPQPSHYSQFQLGGWKTVSSLADADDNTKYPNYIPDERLQLGNAIYSVVDNKVYILTQYSPRIWTEFKSSTSNDYVEGVYVFSNPAPINIDMDTDGNFMNSIIANINIVSIKLPSAGLQNGTVRRIINYTSSMVTITADVSTPIETTPVGSCVCVDGFGAKMTFIYLSDGLGNDFWNII